MAGLASTTTRQARPAPAHIAIEHSKVVCVNAVIERAKHAVNLPILMFSGPFARCPRNLKLTRNAQRATQPTQYRYRHTPHS